MKWRVMGMFLREVAKGRARAARRDLAELGRYRAAIDVARAAGGALDKNLGTQNDSELRHVIERRWYAPAIQKTGARTGLAEVLSLINTKNIPQVVISDYEADYKLEALGIAGHFASIYVGERLKCVKPNPKVFQRVTVDFGILPASLLHIGDRIDRDEAAALAAGCQCLILGRDFRSFGALLAQLRSVIP